MLRAKRAGDLIDYSNTSSWTHKLHNFFHLTLKSYLHKQKNKEKVGSKNEMGQSAPATLYEKTKN